MINEITLYEATDGTRFETAEEAKEYEWRSNWNEQDIELLNDSGEIIAEPWLAYYNDIFYINVKTEEGLAALDFLAVEWDASRETLPQYIGLYKFIEDYWFSPAEWIENALIEWENVEVDWKDIFSKVKEG